MVWVPDFWRSSASCAQLRGAQTHLARPRIISIACSDSQLSQTITALALVRNRRVYRQHRCVELRAGVAPGTASAKRMVGGIQDRAHPFHGPAPFSAQNVARSAADTPRPFPSWTVGTGGAGPGRRRGADGSVVFRWVLHSSRSERTRARLFAARIVCLSHGLISHSGL